MNSASPFPLMLGSLFPQLPLVVVSLVGLVLALTRWRTAPAASRWTLAASLLSLLICVGSPLTQPLLIRELTQRAGSPASTMALYSAGFGLFWATLRALSIGLLLAAVYAGRGQAPVPSPPGYPYPTPSNR